METDMRSVCVVVNRWSGIWKSEACPGEACEKGHGPMLVHRRRSPFILVIIVACFFATFSLPTEASPPTSGLKFWLAADSGITVDGSGGVSSWSDQSGNGNHATQSSSGNRPPVVTNVLNGKPVVRFTASSAQYFSLPNLMSGASAGEVIVLLKSTATGVGLWQFGTGPYGASYPWTDGVNDDFGRSSQFAQGLPPQSITSYRIYNVSSELGLWRSWVDGVQFYKSTSNTVAFTSAPTLGKNNFGSYFSGDIAEILIYDHALSDSERFDVSTYLAQKYALMAVPATPTALFARHINPEEALVSWSIANIPNAPVVYTIDRKAGISGSYVTVGSVTNLCSFIDYGLDPESDYYYRVRATNWAGESDYTSDAALTDPGSGNASFPTSGLKLWLMGDAAPSSPLRYWNDQSGNSNDAAQTNGNNCPTVVNNVINGKPVLRFVAGSSQHFALPNLMNGATAGEVVAVLKSSGTGVGLWHFGSSPYGASYPWTNGVNEDFGRSAEISQGWPVQDVSQFRIYNVSSSSGLWRSWIDGVPLSKSTSNTVSFTSSPKVGKNNYGSHFSGDIAEILVFDRALSDDDRNAIVTYLNQKYAIFPVPSAPTGLQAVALNASTNFLSWKTEIVGSEIDYNLWRSEDDIEWTMIATIRNGGTCFDVVPDMDVDYLYAVQAVSGSGASAFSSSTTVKRNLPTVGELPISGLRLWLMADAAATTSLRHWNDQSGIGNDAVQTTAANRPAAVTNVLNGKPVVRFLASSNQFFPLSNLMSGATAGEVVAVLKSSATPTGLWHFGTSPYGASYPWTNGVNEDFGRSAEFNQGWPARSLTDFRIYNVSSAPGLWESWVDGLRLYKSTSNTVSFTTAPKLGKNNYGTHLSGDVAEVLIYDRRLEAAERRTVQQYLSIKYLLPDFDPDEDGLTNAEESALATDPLDADTNGDGIVDGVSVALGIDPLDLDADGDGLSNAQELALGTNPFEADTDRDGVADSADFYPLDPTRSQAPSSTPGAPVITLTSPSGLVLLP